MIKFEFVVDDIDVENIMGIMWGAVCKCDIDIMNEMVGSNDPKTIQWYRDHQQYLKELMSKMKNYRVDE